MDISLKQRLVGAIVLVALGVIFIPMLLERGTGDDRLTVRMDIPDPPKTAFETPGPAGDEAPEPVEWPEQSVEQASEDARRSMPWNETSTGTPEDDTPAGPGPAPEKANPPAADGAPAAGSQWIVQVGSFSRQSNARELRDRLKTDDRKVFVEAADTAAGTVYRVRVGPLADRETAEALVGPLQKQTGSKPIVMTYP